MPPGIMVIIISLYGLFYTISMYYYTSAVKVKRVSFLTGQYNMTAFAETAPVWLTRTQETPNCKYLNLEKNYVYFLTKKSAYGLKKLSHTLLLVVNQAEFCFYKREKIGN